MRLSEIDSITHHVRSIRVTKLFGRYTYRIPGDGQSLSDISILYGENGAGKTTLLTLVFDLISSAQNKGHKTRISETPFSKLEVTLSDGTHLIAEKESQLLTGPVSFTVERPKKSKINWRFTPGPADSKFQLSDLPPDIDTSKLPSSIKKDVIYALSKRDYFFTLSEIDLSAIMLTSDRMLLGTRGRGLDRSERLLESARSRGQISSLLKDHRSIAVKDALTTTSDWLQRKFLEKSYGARTLDPYQEVVKKIASARYRTKTGAPSKAEVSRIKETLRTRVNDLSDKTSKLAQIGLPRVPFSRDFIETIEATGGNKLNLINEILLPHLEDQEAKLATLMPVLELATNFIEVVNRFLNDKRLIYSISHGLQVVATDESDTIIKTGGRLTNIESSQLSSGEQQLLLLFCNILLAQESNSLVIIDEPEISLNVLWQRDLVTSIQKLIEGTKIQVLLASHSLELLTKHRERVVTMQKGL